MPDSVQVPASPVTLGEVHRTVLAVQSNMNERFSETNGRIDALTAAHLRIDVYRAEQTTVDTRMAGIERGLESRISAIEDGLRWFRRLVVGAMVTAVVTAAIATVIAIAA